MNFLQLCQRTAQESNTVSGTSPTTVVSQTGRLLKFVNWTSAAWVDIQNKHPGWRFLRKDFPSTALTTANTIRYTASSWNITDLGAWLKEPRLITIYDNSVGVSDENELQYLHWDEFRIRYLRGTQTSTRPVHYSISPANEFCLGPTPNTTYRMNGEYRRSAQVMSANADEPICDARHHLIIVWRALKYVHENDEGQFNALTSMANLQSMMFDLEGDYLPEPEIGSEPLA